ncbi:MAG: hypothetical protein HC866_00410 [Leptolyngbyaceae cyanobacterium RU_5_1]|nr:hypothetical protein [Leptolyngbyaceae cyanobacterium RU_5_1]
MGRVFRLGRLILVAPDIPVLTITSGRSNFLRSALRRFEEAYLFSNEGDLALRIASTAANYFSFPAKTRTQGYRLGNVTVCPKNAQTLKSKQRPQAYGILNLDELSNPNCHLLEYLEISVLNKDRSQKLDPANQQTEGEETVASNQEDQESIADLFTYFDCTEYRDRADYNADCQFIDANVLILNGQRSPLKLLDYIRLLVGFATFSPRKFPKGGRDVHGGYFLGKFCKFLMYRLAFLGLQKFLDSLITTSPEELGISTPLPDDLQADLAKILELKETIDPALASLSEGIAPKDAVVLEEEQLAQLRQQRLVALDYLSWICAQKQIQAVFSPERYQVDVLKGDREEVREQMLMRNMK